MTLREAAQQALEALEYRDGDGADQWKADVITALRAALAEPVQEPVGDEWEPCVKIPVTVYVRAQRNGETHVSTREGITPIKPDDLIMRGVSGEEYPIGREIFERTYRRGEAPPQRKPLTDEEIRSMCKQPWVFETVMQWVRAIERAHGIGGSNE